MGIFLYPSKRKRKRKKNDIPRKRKFIELGCKVSIHRTDFANQ